MQEFRYTVLRWSAANHYWYTAGSGYVHASSPWHVAYRVARKLRDQSRNERLMVIGHGHATRNDIAIEV